MFYFDLSAWLTDDLDPQLDYLTRLVESITNLSLNPTAEEWQVSKLILKFH